MLGKSQHILFLEWTEKLIISIRPFKKNHLRISIYETIFCKKNHIFLASIFEPLHFLKSCPNFDELVLPLFSKYNGFILACQFLGKKLAFLDPPSLKFHDRTDIILHMMKVQSLQEIFAKVSSVSSFLNNVVKSSKVIVMH